MKIRENYICKNCDRKGITLDREFHLPFELYEDAKKVDGVLVEIKDCVMCETN